MTREQLNQLVNIYAERVVDGMDTDSLVQFAQEMIIESMPDDEESIMNLVEGYYDEDELNELIDDIKK